MIEAYGIVGGGLVPDTAAAQAALDAVTGEGDEVKFPPVPMLIDAPLRPKSGTRISAPGARFICAPQGWENAGDGSQYGMFTLWNVDSVSFVDVAMTGTLTQPISRTPKLIFTHNVAHLVVDRCVFEDTAFEGIWQGGWARDHRICNSRFARVGRPNSFAGLPAVQMNVDGGQVSGCYFEDVGIGIGLSGRNLSATNNVIKEFSNVGIGTGDGGAGYGSCIVANNVIEFTSVANQLRQGILLGGQPAVHAAHGNSITMNSGDNANCRGIAAVGSHTISDNIIRMCGGVGILMLGEAGTAVLTRTQWNHIQMLPNQPSNGGIGLKAFAANDSTAKLSLYSDSDTVLGAEASNGHSFAFDLGNNYASQYYAAIRNGYYDGGKVRIGGIYYGADNLAGAPFDLGWPA